MRAEQTCDVAIVGGGMVGAALAAALAQHGLAVTVLDAEAPAVPDLRTPQTVDDVEPRVSALTHATQALLTHLGAWEQLPPARLCAYSTMDVWDADGTGSVHFDALEAGTLALGWIVENRQLAAALHRACSAQANIAWRAPVRVAGLVRAGGGWRVELADGTAVTARLLVGADGAQSLVRTQLGFRTREQDYQHRAIVATVQTELVHELCARQRFMDTGPLAFLPLAGGGQHLCSIVWSNTPEEAARLLALETGAFAGELAAALEDRLGGIVAVSPRSAFPLVGRHAARYVQDNAVLVGDAAHTVHPLAGQGVNLGFLDAATLAEEIGNNLARGLPFDEPLALRRYERRRRLHNTLMQTSFAGFKELFASRALPVRWLRNTGMTLLDGAAPLKVLVARQAMGLDGDLPVLCRQAPRGPG